MRVFISGASGLLGGNCLRVFKALGWEVVGSHFSYPTPETVYYDTLNPDSPLNFDLAAFQPEVIIHCGALTHVDYCELHQEESYQKTVESTKSLLKVAKRHRARFVFISTDYVFDGTNGPYLEDAKPNPLNIYGFHKLEAERLVQGLSPHLILRITNVYGEEHRNKNFVSRIVAQCRQGDKLTLRLPFDQFASPTNAYDIARALTLLLEHRKEGIYHIGGTDYMNRVSLALKVLQYFPKATYELQTFSTAALGQPAQRPLYGGFVPARLLSEYPDFLFGTVDTYLREIVQAHPE